MLDKERKERKKEDNRENCRVTWKVFKDGETCSCLKRNGQRPVKMVRALLRKNSLFFSLLSHSTQNTYFTSGQQMCVFIPTPNNSPTPVGCPTIQFHSDTTWNQYQISQVKASVPQDSLHFTHQWQVRGCR